MKLPEQKMVAGRSRTPNLGRILQAAVDIAKKIEVFVVSGYSSIFLIQVVCVGMPLRGAESL